MTGDPVTTCYDNGLLSWDMSACNIFSEPVLSSHHFQSLSPSGSDTSNISDNLPSSNTNTPLDDVANERKRKRRLSNRESAKRSRIRKQKHVESLWTELNRLKVENQELANRVHAVSNQTRILLSENDRLHAEHAMLRLLLSDMNQMLLLRKLEEAWPYNHQIIY